MNRMLGIVLLITLVAAVELDQDYVSPETLDQLLSEKKYEEFSKHLGIDVKYVRPIEGTDDRKYNKSLCVTDLVYPSSSAGNSPSLWPKTGAFSTIPFYITEAPAKLELKSVLQSISSFSSKFKTMIQLKLHNEQKDYVYIFQGPSCFAAIGRRGGPQAFSVNEGCLTDPFVLHSVMHMAGIPHEHNKNDRDKYIKINTENLVDGGNEAYQKYAAGDYKIPGRYDHFSITHFPLSAFSKKGTDAYDVVNEKIDKRFMGKFELTIYDSQKVKALYG